MMWQMMAGAILAGVLVLTGGAFAQTDLDPVDVDSAADATNEDADSDVSTDASAGPSGTDFAADGSAADPTGFLPGDLPAEIAGLLPPDFAFPPEATDFSIDWSWDEEGADVSVDWYNEATDSDASFDASEDEGVLESSADSSSPETEGGND